MADILRSAWTSTLIPGLYHCMFLSRAPEAIIRSTHHASDCGSCIASPQLELHASLAKICR